MPAELAGDWPDAVRPQASQTADVRAARGKYATGGIVPGDKSVEACKARFDNLVGENIVPRGARTIDIPISIMPSDMIKGKMAEAMDHVRNILTGTTPAPIEQVIVGPSGVVRIRILCPNCGARSQTEQPFKNLVAGPSHTMHGRKGRLVDIHVGARCCGKELHAKVPVWLEDDWC